jgi:hypothetical protein
MQRTHLHSNFHQFIGEQIHLSFGLTVLPDFYPQLIHNHNLITYLVKFISNSLPVRLNILLFEFAIFNVKDKFCLLTIRIKICTKAGKKHTLKNSEMSKKNLDQFWKSKHYYN